MQALLQHPMVPFIAGLVTIVFLLVKLDLPAFLGLIFATFVVGLVTPAIPVGEVPNALEKNFADTLEAIGIPILMAAIIGKTIMESGAAERIVRVYLSITGEERADISMLGSGFFLVIPVFLRVCSIYSLRLLGRCENGLVGTWRSIFRRSQPVRRRLTDWCCPRLALSRSHRSSGLISDFRYSSVFASPPSQRFRPVSSTGGGSTIASMSAP